MEMKFISLDKQKPPLNKAVVAWYPDWQMMLTTIWITEDIWFTPLKKILETTKSTTPHPEPTHWRYVAPPDPKTLSETLIAPDGI